MKRMKIMGLCFVAVFAFSAVAATSAFASERPEYESCVKVSKITVKYEQEKIVKGVPTSTSKEKAVYNGLYKNSLCTEAETAEFKADPPTIENPTYEGPVGKYERVEVAEGTPIASKGKTAVFTVEGKTVTCKKSTDAGEILDQFTDADKITFGDCELPAETVKNIMKPTVTKSIKVPCTTSGQESKTIQTDQLASNLYFSSGAENSALLALNGEEGVFAEFTCKGVSPAGYEPANETTVVIEGTVLGSVENTTKGETIDFAAPGGHQAIQEVWLFGSLQGPITLEANGEEASLATTNEQTPKNLFAFTEEKLS